MFLPLDPCNPGLPLGPMAPSSPFAPGIPGNPGGPAFPTSLKKLNKIFINLFFNLEISYIEPSNENSILSETIKMNEKFKKGSKSYSFKL